MSVSSSPSKHLAGVRSVSLPAGETELSGLLALAEEGTSSNDFVLALHGRATNARYFHGGAHPSVSFLRYAAAAGWNVLALDRPGYGTSAGDLPRGQKLAEQSATLRQALHAFGEVVSPGARFLVLGHSYGGKLALRLAADDTEGRILGVDVSGCASVYSSHGRLPPANLVEEARLNWGPLRLYPPGTFQSTREIASPVPPREDAEWSTWTDRFANMASRVKVPLRFTFAEHEHWWDLGDTAIAGMTEQLSSAPEVRVCHQAGAGHNISLSWAAPEYHEKVLSFFTTCLSR